MIVVVVVVAVAVLFADLLLWEGLDFWGNDGLLGAPAGVATGWRVFWVVVLDLLLLVGFISAGKRTEE